MSPGYPGRGPGSGVASGFCFPLLFATFNTSSVFLRTNNGEPIACTQCTTHALIPLMFHTLFSRVGRPVRPAKAEERSWGSIRGGFPGLFSLHFSSPSFLPIFLSLMALFLRTIGFSQFLPSSAMVSPISKEDFSQCPLWGAPLNSGEVPGAMPSPLPPPHVKVLALSKGLNFKVHILPPSLHALFNHRKHCP